MSKSRTFEKLLTIENFRLAKKEVLARNAKLTGKSVRETVTIIVEVIFTPRGYRVEIQLDSPLIVWDFEQACKLKGITETNPEGDLIDKNFPTELSAMHFITRRLSKLGWAAVNSWETE